MKDSGIIAIISGLSNLQLTCLKWQIYFIILKNTFEVGCDKTHDMLIEIR